VDSECGATARRDASYSAYRLYGLTVEVDRGIASLRRQAVGGVDVTFARRRGFPLGTSLPAPPGSFSYEVLPDGREFLRRGEDLTFVVTVDGHRVDYSLGRGAAVEEFETYALNQALSLSLLRLGREPLHANAIETDGGAIALFGQSGAGKSTLSAYFLAAGNRMLTDDLLVLEPSSEGVMVQPGIARIKLAPETVQAVLPGVGRGRINVLTNKLELPLASGTFCGEPTELRRIYVLRRTESDRITIRALSSKAAVMALIRHTFNVRVVRPERLKMQFEHALWVLDSVPMRTLSYPRDIERLADVRAAVARDLER